MSTNPLFNAQGQRLYLTEDERSAFLDASADAPRDVRTFSGFLPGPSKRFIPDLSPPTPAEPGAELIPARSSAY